MLADIDAEKEPRVDKGIDRKSDHPFFWAGYLLVDTGFSPTSGEKPVENPKKGAPPKKAAAGGAAAGGAAAGNRTGDAGDKTARVEKPETNDKPKTDSKRNK